MLNSDRRGKNLSESIIFPNMFEFPSDKSIQSDISMNPTLDDDLQASCPHLKIGHASSMSPNNHGLNSRIKILDSLDIGAHRSPHEPRNESQNSIACLTGKSSTQFIKQSGESLDEQVRIEDERDLSSHYYQDTQERPTYDQEFTVTKKHSSSLKNTPGVSPNAENTNMFKANLIGKDRNHFTAKHQSPTPDNKDQYITGLKGIQAVFNDTNIEIKKDFETPVIVKKNKDLSPKRADTSPGEMLRRQISESQWGSHDSSSHDKLKLLMEDNKEADLLEQFTNDLQENFESGEFKELLGKDSDRLNLDNMQLNSIPTDNSPWDSRKDEIQKIPAKFDYGRIAEENAGISGRLNIETDAGKIFNNRPNMGFMNTQDQTIPTNLTHGQSNPGFETISGLTDLGYQNKFGGILCGPDSVKNDSDMIANLGGSETANSPRPTTNLTESGDLDSNININNLCESDVIVNERKNTKFNLQLNLEETKMNYPQLSQTSKYPHPSP